MKIAIIAPRFKDFVGFVNSYCDTLGISKDEVANVSNGIISFKSKNIHFIWNYTIFTTHPNYRLLLKYDTIIILSNFIDKEMEECYNFLIERNPNAKQICSDFKT